MKYKEFLEYIEANLEGYHIFMAKAGNFQREQNANRAKKSRWQDGRIEKATYDMWKKAMEPLYNKLKSKIKSDSRLTWTSYIEKNDIFESINEGIMNIEQLKKERDTALLSLNKEKILKYCQKYQVRLPGNELAFWAGIHKAIYMIPSAPLKQKEDSKQWLLQHGFHIEIK